MLDPLDSPLIIEMALVAIRRSIFEKAMKDVSKMLTQKLEHIFHDENFYAEYANEIKVRLLTNSISSPIRPASRFITENRWNEYEEIRKSVKITSGKSKLDILL